jgi:FkbM family methyltransferase
MKIIRFGRNLLSGNSLLNKLIRKFSRIILALLLRKGIKIDIGKRYPVRMCVDFIGYENFGKGHNSGWRKCIEMCKSKKVFFDIGAHVGLYTIPAAMEIGENGKVYAFEPGEKNYDYLCRHVNLNKKNNVFTYNYLVGNADSNTVFFEDVNNSNPMNSLVVAKNHRLYKQTLRQQIKLDSFCIEQNIFPDMLKIDVEGAELFVLQGASKILEKYHPIIFLSIHPKLIELMGYSVSILISYIAKLNYDILNIDLAKADTIGFNEYILFPKVVVTGNIT